MRLAGEAAMSSGIAGKTMNSLVQMGASFIEQGFKAEGDMQVLIDQVQSMVDENREPTDEEWSDLQARSEEAHEIFEHWRNGY